MSHPVLPTGWTLAAFDSIGSTNDEAARRAAQGVPEGLVVWALRQETGRGRRGRHWVSPPGNLYCSTVLRPDCPADRAAQIGFVAALGVADTIAARVAEAEVTLKWPNDVLVAGAKICGILPESSVGADGRVEHVVVGIGINIASGPEPSEVGYAVTCLSAHGAACKPAELLSSLLANLRERYGAWCREGFAPVRTAWLERGANRGEGIRVRAGNLDFCGRFVDLDADGALLVEIDHETRRVTAGEVFPLARRG
jgi:BirA family biotin operon repressor/biotin-[acetyl-CoA-carboxylase] ligase